MMVRGEIYDNKARSARTQGLRAQRVGMKVLKVYAAHPGDARTGNIDRRRPVILKGDGLECDAAGRYGAEVDTSRRNRKSVRCDCRHRLADAYRCAGVEIRIAAIGRND